MSESNFGSYSQYYDLMYHNKNYRTEVDFVLGLLHFDLRPEKALIELGSGTAIHAVEFARRGFLVRGIDQSEAMVKMANVRLSSEAPELRQKIEITCADARSFRFSHEMPYCVSLFHVASYQTTNNDFTSYLKTANSCLKLDGNFVFDFWYGPCVLSEKPEVRTKTAENSDIRVTRFAEPKIDLSKNIVYVQYSIDIENKKTAHVEKIKEIHPMRYFFLPELEYFLNQNGFELKKSGEWLTQEPLSEKSWGGYVVAKKVKSLINA